MHEMALCESAMQVIEQQSAQNGVRRVTAVWLEVGALACVEISALTFCFDAVSRNTLAEGCKLHVRVKPAQAWCWDCCQTVVINQRGEACPHCQGYRLRVDDGETLRIQEIEVE